jgi:hypothetical protein
MPWELKQTFCEDNYLPCLLLAELPLEMQGETLLVSIGRRKIQADRLVQAGRQVSNYKQTDRLAITSRQTGWYKQVDRLVHAGRQAILVDRKSSRYRETGRLKKADSQVAQIGLSRDDGSILAIAKQTTSHF